MKDFKEIPEDAGDYYWHGNQRFDLIEASDGKLIKVPKTDLVSAEANNNDNLIEKLRKEALALYPRHGDKLYPLEVLGVYGRVLKQKIIIDLEIGNPEVYIDDRIKNWIQTVNKNHFINRLERELTQNEITKELFLLRLNYAYLLEEGQDEINIHRNQKDNLLFYDHLDAEGNYQGALKSAFDLSDEQLDELASKFYAKKQNVQKTKTGTKQSIRNLIIDRITQMGYVINYNLDEVYNTLNNNNIINIEEGLLARIAYLVFISEAEKASLNKIQNTPNASSNETQDTPKLQSDKRIMYCRHCGTQFYDSPNKMFCSKWCENMFERFNKK